MKSKLVIACLLTLVFSSHSIAGPFTDQLSRCLVNKTTVADRELLIKWVYIAMSSHKAVRQYSNISAQIGDDMNKNTAELFMNLLTERCKSEAVKAHKYEKDIALKASFEMLGKVAMQGIMTAPSVSVYMGGLQKYIDKKKLDTIFPR